MCINRHDLNAVHTVYLSRLTVVCRATQEAGMHYIHEYIDRKTNSTFFVHT